MQIPAMARTMNFFAAQPVRFQGLSTDDGSSPKASLTDVKQLNDKLPEILLGRPQINVADPKVWSELSDGKFAWVSSGVAVSLGATEDDKIYALGIFSATPQGQLEIHRRLQAQPGYRANAEGWLREEPQGIIICSIPFKDKQIPVVIRLTSGHGELQRSK